MKTNDSNMIPYIFL